MKNKSGLTLIELVVYMAISSFLILSAIFLMITISYGSSKLDNLLKDEEEGFFLMEKIETVEYGTDFSGESFNIISNIIQSPIVSVTKLSTGHELVSNFLVGSSTFSFDSYTQQ